MRQLQAVPAGVRGHPVGQHHGKAKHSDALVEKARLMRAAGMMYKDIEKSLGISRSTILYWCRGKRRNTAAIKTVMRRRHPREVME